MPANVRDPIHPQVQFLFTMMSAGRATRVLEPGPMRAGFGALGPLLAAGAPTVNVDTTIQIPGPGGAIRARVFAPDPARGPYPVIVFFHGGGYVVMSPETHEKLCMQLCLGANAVVVSVDYRLAPEHPFPAPTQDCLAAFRWVRENAAQLGGDAARVAAAGDSAGGNATAALALQLIASKEAPPTALMLLCPWLDMAFESASFKKYAPDDPLIDDETMKWFRTCYLKPSQYKDPIASPVLADAKGFPPTLIVVGEIDPLRDDGVAFAAKLEKAGAKVTLSSHAGMPHDFMLFPGLDEGERALALIYRFAKGALTK